MLHSKGKLINFGPTIISAKPSTFGSKVSSKMKEENVEASSTVIKTETDFDFGSFECMEHNDEKPMVLDVEEAAFTCTKHELSDPLSIDFNDQRPTKLELEEAEFTSKKREEYFLIKEIATIETDDVSPEVQTGLKTTFVVDFEPGRQLSETFEQKEKRFVFAGFDEEERPLVKKVTSGRRRQNETVEQREKRQLVERIRQQKYREDKAEKVEQTRLKHKIFYQKLMESETVEQKEKRLLDTRIRQRMYRETETIEEAKKRRFKHKIMQRKRNESETAEQKEKRLLDARIKARKYRENETPEQREHRLLQGLAWRLNRRKRSKAIKSKNAIEADYELDVTIFNQACYEEQAECNIFTHEREQLDDKVYKEECYEE